MTARCAESLADAGSAGFDSFDAVWCLRDGTDQEGAARLRKRWRAMGLVREVGTVPVVFTPADRRIGVLASHRRLIEAAAAEGAESILVFDERTLWHEQAGALLADATTDLARHPWTMLVLGAYAPLSLPLLPGCRALARAAHGTDLHAMAYHRRAFARLLEDWPADVAQLAEYVKAKAGLDAYVAAAGRAFAVQPFATSIADLLPFLPPALQHAYPA